MKVCGIVLKGNEAILTGIEGSLEDYEIMSSLVKKIKLEDSLNQADVQSFSIAMNQLLEDNNFDRVGIKARMTKGKFAGGSTSFKMEALIQNTPFKVDVIHGATIKSKLKSIEIDSSAVKKYQEESLKVGIYLLKAF